MRLYSEEQPHEAVAHLEAALREYVVADTECRALCEGPYDYDGYNYLEYNADLFQAIAGLRPGPALPCLPSPALPSPALLCPALPCPPFPPLPSLPCPSLPPLPSLPSPALPCLPFPFPPLPPLPCAALPCCPLPSPALPCSALPPSPALSCPALPSPTGVVSQDLVQTRPAGCLQPQTEI